MMNLGGPGSPSGKREGDEIRRWEEEGYIRQRRDVKRYEYRWDGMTEFWWERGKTRQGVGTKKKDGFRGEAIPQMGGSGGIAGNSQGIVTQRGLKHACHRGLRGGEPMGGGESTSRKRNEPRWGGNPAPEIWKNPLKGREKKRAKKMCPQKDYRLKRGGENGNLGKNK